MGVGYKREGGGGGKADAVKRGEGRHLQFMVEKVTVLPFGVVYVPCVIQNTVRDSSLCVSI